MNSLEVISLNVALLPSLKIASISIILSRVTPYFIEVLPEELLPIGLALIFAVDRPLDMMRTTVNVTGDATVSMIVAKSLGKLRDKPEEKN